MSLPRQRRSIAVFLAIVTAGLAWCAVPSCSKGPPPGMALVQCQSNLRQIQFRCMLYADASGKRTFPHSEKGPITSLQILVDADHSLAPSLFICPSSVQAAADVADGKFHLDEDHCSYAMAPWKVSNSDPAETMVAFDRTPCHDGGRNVVHLDRSVERLAEAKFQELFSRQASARGAAIAPPASSR